MLDVATLIDFEAAHPRPTETKNAAILEQLDLQPTRYYQQLTRILATPHLREAATLHDPITTNRLVRLQEQRAKTRKARSL
ncbi:DUF3263 domain-containing protein [Agromyces sp. SYSU T00194]|uniref:DUF3263 domain-containing protein n=1 Tax=Agromyces chitinivorans TaxID=3158560 RepID=UPI0033921DE6